MIGFPTHRVIATGEIVFPEGYDPAAIELLDNNYWPARRLADAKAAAVLQIDKAAEAARGSFLTPGAGQALTYQRKETEARAWASGDSAAQFPFLAAEAQATDVAIDALAQNVIAQADAWTAAGSAIEGLRMGAKKAVADAATMDEVAAALVIEWPQPAA